MLNQKVWLITGASTGLGLSLAKVVVSRGDKLIVLTRKEFKNNDIVGQAFDRVKIITMDATNPRHILFAIQEAQDAFGRIDILINFADNIFLSQTNEVRGSQQRAELESVMTSSILAIKTVLPIMIKQGSGHIIQISYWSGQDTTRKPSINLDYSIEGFMLSLSDEVIHWELR